MENISEFNSDLASSFYKIKINDYATLIENKFYSNEVVDKKIKNEIFYFYSDYIDKYMINLIDKTN